MDDPIKDLRDKAALFREKAVRALTEKERDVLLAIVDDCELTIARMLKSQEASENRSADMPEPSDCPRVAQ
jgi:hypothetical protein